MNFARSRLIGAIFVAMLTGNSAAAPSRDVEATESTIEKADYFKPGFAPVHAPKSYDVTIVYFFDYQCPTCRKYHADVSKALAEDKRVRVIYRDTPIFGPRSDAAAYAAIASQLQGRHAAMHDALMSTSGPLDVPALRAAARKANVDWDRLQRDIEGNKSRIEALVTRNFELATDAGIYGTPAFIVADTLANGALDYAGLTGEIADARKSLRTDTPASTPSSTTKPKVSAASGANQPTEEGGNQRPKGQDSEVSEDSQPASATSAPNIWLASWPAWMAAALALIAIAAGAITWRRRASVTAIEPNDD